MPALGVGGAAWTILRARKPPGWRIKICRIGWVSPPGLASENQALAREFCGARSRPAHQAPPAGLFDTLLDAIDAGEETRAGWHGRNGPTIKKPTAVRRPAFMRSLVKPDYR